MTLRDNNELNISWLCQNAGVSRSGYYNWLDSDYKRSEKDLQDKADFELILQAYQFRGYDKGRRGIYMRLLNMEIRMNQKKISRLMKKFNLFCPIRKANPYRRMAKALKTGHVAENLVNRKFREQGSRKILLTDITYMLYGNRCKAYSSALNTWTSWGSLFFKLTVDILSVIFILLMVLW